MSSDSPRHLFVYGTLLPGLAPPMIAEVANTLRIIGPGKIAGRLYNLGAYPGCVPDGSCEGVIYGQVLEVPDPEALERLDWYEGYVAHDAAGSLFTRTTCRPIMEDGSQILCWVYVYNRDTTRARLIESGRYDPAWK